jgi:hypothetical protein
MYAKNRMGSAALVLVWVFLLFIGCGKNNELTREKAKEIIELNYPILLVHDVVIGEIDTLWLLNPQKTINTYKALANAGLILITQHKSVTGLRPYVQITNEGKKYLQKIDRNRATVIIGKTKVADITGIILSLLRNTSQNLFKTGPDYPGKMA